MSDDVSRALGEVRVVGEQLGMLRRALADSGFAFTPALAEALVVDIPVSAVEIPLEGVEVEGLVAALGRLLEAGDMPVTIRSGVGSSWLEVVGSSRRFAVWRETGALFELDATGAVGEEPVWEPGRG